MQLKEYCQPLYCKLSFSFCGEKSLKRGLKQLLQLFEIFLLTIMNHARKACDKIQFSRVHRAFKFSSKLQLIFN